MMWKERRWRIFYVLTAMYVIAYFYRVSAAVIAGDLARDLSLSPGELGKMSAALFYAFALTQLPLGPLLDRVGPRRVIFGLGLVTATGAFLFASSTGYAGAFWGRLLIGTGTACVLMGSLKVYSAWFSAQRFATLAGLQVAIGNTGNVLATAPLAWLAGTIGWRGSFYAFSALTLLGALAVLVIVRDAPAEKPPEERMPFWKGWRQIMGRLDFWRISLLAFFWYGTYMAVQGLWGGPYLQNVFGFSREGAGTMLLLSAVGFIVGCPVMGRLSDRVLASRKKVIVPGQLGLLVLAVLLLGPLEKGPTWVLPFYFFFFGLCVSTGPVLFAQIKEMFPASQSATAMTAVNFFVVMGAAVMQQTMGTILGQGAGHLPVDFHRAFAIPVAGLAVTWVFYLFVRTAGWRDRA